MPDNTYLLCGDSLLDSQVNDLISTSGAASAPLGEAYTDVMGMMRDFVQEAAAHFSQIEQKSLVVFVDTNPAPAVYTQLGLIAMTDLIIPFDADNFSLQVTCWTESANCVCC